MTIHPLLTVDDLAAYLSKPKATLYAWRTRKLGPKAVRVGGNVRYRWEDVEEWIAEHVEE
ncbi:helix-turn-helix transcriptional regulator [Spelaeicoccus albus]|uniref:Excisionase family DNA binding protein n=2 Tax=Spelaeicoccus albus TaxID=1280376 RepID=A0A7Z0D3K7_9MICO|nr:excisionase family DNA binding protein [Spelaeicoccus albus]